MSEDLSSCQAITKAGTPCKNRALGGSRYCYVHRRLAGGAAEPPPAPPSPVQDVIGDVNKLAEELKKETPSYQPPPFSPQTLLAVLQQNVERFAPQIRVPLLGELRHSLEGTKPEDLIDPDTWKGLWYILNYTAQAQSKQAIEQIEQRIAGLPGGQALVSIKGGLEGASPKDLLDVEMWKGAWLILNATVAGQANDIRRKVLGEE